VNFLLPLGDWLLLGTLRTRMTPAEAGSLAQLYRGPGRVLPSCRRVATAS